jgi:hypothetical protein
MIARTPCGDVEEKKNGAVTKCAAKKLQLDYIDVILYIPYVHATKLARVFTLRATTVVVRYVHTRTSDLYSTSSNL